MRRTFHQSFRMYIALLWSAVFGPPIVRSPQWSSKKIPALSDVHGNSRRGTGHGRRGSKHSFVQETNRGGTNSGFHARHQIVSIITLKAAVPPTLSLLPPLPPPRRPTQRQREREAKLLLWGAPRRGVSYWWSPGPPRSTCNGMSELSSQHSLIFLRRPFSSSPVYVSYSTAKER
jgi:hypothetical protein